MPSTPPGLPRYNPSRVGVDGGRMRSVRGAKRCTFHRFSIRCANHFDFTADTIDNAKIKPAPPGPARFATPWKSGGMAVAPGCPPAAVTVKSVIFLRRRAPVQFLANRTPGCVISPLRLRRGTRGKYPARTWENSTCLMTQKG